MTTTTQTVVEEIPLANVEDFAAMPPGKTGRPKLGQLIFNASFESGNLGRVKFVSECEYDLFIRGDTANTRHRVWFFFSVKNVRSEQRVIFNVVNFSKPKSLYRDGMAPVVQSSSRPGWQRIPARNVFYYKSPKHQDNHIMSFAFAFDRDDDVYYFAYCFPYTYTRLQDYITGIEAKHISCFHRDLLGLSEQKRRLDLITITSPLNLSVSGKQRVIFITARVHPGETPASFACEGIINFLISDDAVAQKLRDSYVFKIVPMLNPDGVFLGNYRCSLMGFDLNRHWHQPSAWAQPTLFATKKLLLQYNTNPNMHLDFYIDIHSHTTSLNTFLYGNVFSKDPSRCERQVVLPTLLSDIAEDFCLEKTEFNMDPVKAGTSRRTFGGALDNESLCYTLEMSCFGFARKEDPTKIIAYTEDMYMRVGEHLAVAFQQFRDAEDSSRTIDARPYSSFVTRVVDVKPPKTSSKKAATKIKKEP